MQDRFKFRVWDKEKKRYNCGMLIFDYMRGVLDPEKYILEQCTALKDKNGNLIWEGDIVEYKIPGIPKISAIVAWSPTSVRFWKGAQDIATYQKSTVIIGNINENPELIPKSNIYRY